jgi:oligogalacturonide lyase
MMNKSLGLYQGDTMKMQRTICRIADSITSEIGRFRSHSLQAIIAIFLLLTSSIVCVAQDAGNGQATQSKILPYSWVDADNGYHVLRMTSDPESRALDSRRNAFTPDGKDMIYLSKNGIAVLNLSTRKIKYVVTGRIASLAVGTKSRRVFFSRGTDIYLYVVDLDTGAITKLADLPIRAEVMSVNSDETLIVGKNIKPGDNSYQDFRLKASQEADKEIETNSGLKISADDLKERAMKLRAAAQIPEEVFTVDLHTGHVNTIMKTTDWIGYAQFSPTDPTLIMYAHEGMYYETNRIWTIRSDGSQNQLIHQRTDKEESATREFWSQDGKTIWYEWQKPRGKSYALVGYDVATGKRRLFKMDKEEASISYNAASGDAFFVGSGHHASSAREGTNRGGKQSIEILYPVFLDKNTQADPQLSSLFNFNDEMTQTYPDAKYVGWFRRVTIASMSKSDYTKLEPNIRISPDNKYVIFTSNILGPTYVFAVELNAQ